MKKLISIVFSILSICFLFTSCLSNDDDETTYTNECVITAFTLGTLNQYSTVEASDGSDSIVKDTVTGSKYKFTIDQRNLTISNVDSLPLGTDLTKVVATITAEGYYVTFVRNDSTLYFSSSDSLDYTNGLQFTVHAYDGTSSKTYSVKLNTHQTYSDSLLWSKSTVSSFPASKLDNMKSVYKDGKVYIFGTKSGALNVSYASVDDTNSWSALTPANGISGTPDVNNIVVFGDSFYIVADGKMYSSTDATNWSIVCNENVTRLLASSSYELFAVKDGKFASYSDGKWTEEGNEDIASLPTTCVAYASHTMKHNSTMEKVILTGISENVDSCGVVFNKISAADTENRQNWVYIPNEYINAYALPRLKNLSVFQYNDELYAFGGAGIKRSSDLDAFEYLYTSGDEGITWKAHTLLTTTPEDLEGDDTDFTTVVDKKHNAILIIFKNGTIWRGYIPEIYIK